MLESPTLCANTAAAETPADVADVTADLNDPVDAADSVLVLARLRIAIHVSHTRCLPAVGHHESVVLLREQSLHTNSPHLRQWCLLRIKPKRFLHTVHSLASLSGCHTGADSADAPSRP